MIPADFGARVRSIRESQNLSGREVARRSDNVISQSSLSRIEQGLKEPHTGEILALSWILNVSVEDLTDPVPLKERVTWVARSESEQDISAVREALLPYLQLRITLDALS